MVDGSPSEADGFLYYVMPYVRLLTVPSRLSVDTFPGRDEEEERMESIRIRTIADLEGFPTATADVEVRP